MSGSRWFWRFDGGISVITWRFVIDDERVLGLLVLVLPPAIARVGPFASPIDPERSRRAPKRCPESSRDPALALAMLLVVVVVTVWMIVVVTASDMASEIKRQRDKERKRERIQRRSGSGLVGWNRRVLRDFFSLGSRYIEQHS